VQLVSAYIHCLLGIAISIPGLSRNLSPPNAGTLGLLAEPKDTESVHWRGPVYSPFPLPTWSFRKVISLDILRLPSYTERKGAQTFSICNTFAIEFPLLYPIAKDNRIFAFCASCSHF